MIKINLAKGRPASKASSASSDSGGVSSGDSIDDGSLRKIAITRFLVIALGPIGLLVYEQILIPDLQAQLVARQAELAEVRDKNERAQEAVTQIKRFKREQEILQAQINSIENLKKDRLREVKILDFLQKDIPERLWLTRMEMTEGRLLLQGMATTDGELTQFMENLSRSAYLKEVSLIRSTDQVTTEFGAVKRFEVSCLMERP